MRKILATFFISWLFPALPTLAADDCQTALRTVEKTLGMKLREINLPSTKPVAERTFRRTVAVAAARLNYFGIPFRRIEAAEMRERGLRNYRPVIVSETPATGRRARYKTAMLLEIGEFPELPRVSSVFDRIVISHAMPALQRRLTEIGTRIFIDPTLRRSPAGALFDPQSKAIFLDDDPIFADVVHEWGHAEFWNADVPGFCRQYRRRIKTGQPTIDLFQNPVYLQYGPMRLGRVAALLDAGVPTGAIDEHEAALRVIHAVGNFADSYKFEIDQVSRYSDSYLISEYARRAALRPLRPHEREMWLRYLRDDRFVEDIRETGDDAHDLIYEYEALAAQALR